MQPQRPGKLRPPGVGGAIRSAESRNAGSPRPESRARLIVRDLDPGRILTPEPLATTRAAVSGWSRPTGMQTTGTPCDRALITVP